MHALQLNYRGNGNGQRAPRHNERGAQRPWAALNYTVTALYLCYCRIQETPRAPDTGGHTGGSRETPEGPEGTSIIIMPLMKQLESLVFYKHT